MASTSSKIGRGMAKGLGIKLEDAGTAKGDKVTRGESVFSVSSADTYVEEEPTVAEWFSELAPSRKDVFRYFKNLFPFLHWITRYNSVWLSGDLVAGITVGAVVVPQGMAYARLAEVPVEFGLYSSFMGVLIYWFFATSKDITIGPVAVMSTIVGNIVLRSQETLPDVEGYVIASALAVVSGGIVLALGLARLGWLVEFISLTAISAFMTGSAISIAAGQVPALMGFSSLVNNRQSPYLVIIQSFKHLPDTKMDAAIGLTALTMLYLIRIICSQMAKRNPHQKKSWFFVSTLRTAFVILLYTMISWLANRNRRSNPLFRIVGRVPRGFQHAQVPQVTSSIVGAFASELPATVIVLLIEHISISKSFGRINNYTIDPSQELVAIGVTNLLGPFLGGYPATGSFSRTAIKSKAGVRTPFAGVITAIVVLLAIYALPAVFFYIPNAGLSGVIIHAVGDLITPPNTIYHFWRISPLEVPIFFAGVFVTVFTNIENGIYTTITISAALLLYRVFKARGRFLGRVKVHSVIGDHLLDKDNDEPKADKDARPAKPRAGGKEDSIVSTRNIFLPIDHHDGSNPQIELNAPYPGIFIYRFSEGYNYPNANHYLDYMTTVIMKHTRRTNPHSYGKLGDRPWNDPGPRRGKQLEIDTHLPTLKAIILDFSSVNNVDITSVQHMIDVRNQLDRYTSPETVEWHFACINNRWTKRALAAAGFGLPNPEFTAGEATQRWKPIFSVAEIGGSDSAAHAAEYEEDRENLRRIHTNVAPQYTDADDIETGNRHGQKGVDDEQDSLDKALSQTKAYGKEEGARIAVIHGLNRPLFHIDLTSAVQAAIANVEAREKFVPVVEQVEGPDPAAP
ncbi:SulP family sulfate permease [Coniosporium apollinis CBS 100218]|uniref:SulP family sulfate permease n=1 Tax=Coniosporium apollinis (strain CBS 100218) TaxID=1168221 RepID=R7YQT9_CONA1|nr:SulP family sulfate permease [Coniosporium apollinis CBS 100218]EON64277.1 SulP family sulfate permease [Coniosporium apollinis CBS 100218]